MSTCRLHFITASEIQFAPGSSIRTREKGLRSGPGPERCSFLGITPQPLRGALLVPGGFGRGAGQLYTGAGNIPRRSRTLGIEQTLLTALLSGVVSCGAAFALNERRDRRQALVAKTEEAAVAFMALSEAVSAWIAYHLIVIRSHESADTLVHKAEDLWSQLLTRSNRATMLINAYVPHRAHVLDELAGTYQPFIVHSSEILHFKRDAPLAGEIFANRVSAAGVKAAHAGRAGIQLLITEVRTRANAPHLIRFPHLLRRFRTKRGGC